MSTRGEPSLMAPAGQAVLVLASQSPQRLALLRQVGFEPVCLPANVDETPQADEPSDALVQRLAESKAHACATQNVFLQSDEVTKRWVVVAADTVIDLDGKTLGKPSGKAHALQMLQALSDRGHYVHSGLCVLEPDTGNIQTRLVSTRVQFGKIPTHIAQRYWETGEPRGKSGSYAIQGLGAQFVVSLSGSYSNVVGLPLFETTELLARAGIPSLN